VNLESMQRLCVIAVGVCKSWKC